MTGYGHRELRAAYEAIGLRPGDVVSLKTDIRPLGPCAEDGREAVLAAHLRALAEAVDLSRGTIVVSTQSLNLCNTDIPFDPEATPSGGGVLTEYIRRQPGAVRSFHPFVSYTALGRHAQDICGEVSRYAFGLETPKQRLLDLGAICVSLGLQPRFTCSVVHQVESVVGVPFRYLKEFMHPVVRGGEVRREPFYMYVWYRECDLKKDANHKIFANYAAHGGTVAEAPVGRGHVYAYPLKPFFDITVAAFLRDPYMSLETPPTVRPYQK